MSEHDRQMWEGWAQSLREDLARMPRHRFNETKIRDREAELRRIETKLARESELHARFIARRAELAARCYAAPRMGGPR
jgi:hypothetical protein